MRGEKINKVCQSCGAKFEDYVSNKRSDFCSLKCYWNARKTDIRYRGYWTGKKRDKETIKKIARAKIGKPSPRKGIILVPEEMKRANRANWASQRRAIKRGNGGYHTKEQWEELKNIYKHTCPRCRKCEPEIKLTVDHILPVGMGGSNNIENIQPLCSRCNSSKGDRHTKKYDF